MNILTFKTNKEDFVITRKGTIKESQAFAEGMEQGSNNSKYLTKHIYINSNGISKDLDLNPQLIVN
jgi:hypothetical protein|tara:strand:- start:760 stop:957 length:198 start_codon:yes stop_codon:yes gene_type:complete